MEGRGIEWRGHLYLDVRPRRGKFLQYNVLLSRRSLFDLHFLAEGTEFCMMGGMGRLSLN